MKGSIFQCSTNTENVNKFLMYELLSSFKKKKQKQKKNCYNKLQAQWCTYTSLIKLGPSEKSC